MKTFTKKAIVTVVVMAGSQVASAGTDVFFNPLNKGDATQYH